MAHRSSNGRVWRAYAALGFAYWVPQLYAAWRVRRDIPLVRDMPRDPHRQDWPTVSVIMTARDEERAIEEALRSRLSDEYPALELIVVDDRSTDRTGEIVDALAAEHARLKAVHVDELPEGWVGKVYAMSRGLDAAAGEWILFSDADVAVESDLLTRVVAYAEENGFEHIAVYPSFAEANPLIDLVLTASSRVGLAGSAAWKVSDPTSKAAIGVGSFNLVKRSALDRTAGLEWLRLEIADDISLGQMLKESGARQQLANGTGFASVDFYPTVKDALTGSERALFTAIGNFSMARCLAIGVGLAGLELSPFILPLARDRLVRRLGFILLGVELTASLAFTDWLERPRWHAALAPFGAAMMGALIARAGVIGRARGGVYWRGTFYPTELLKPGRRFRP